MRRLVLFVFVISTIISASSVQAQAGKAEAAISEIMQQHQVVGLAVAVVKKGKISYTHSFGVKNVETKAPLTEESIFRIASISKSFPPRPLCSWWRKRNCHWRMI